MFSLVITKLTKFVISFYIQNGGKKKFTKIINVFSAINQRLKYIAYKFLQNSILNKQLIRRTNEFCTRKFPLPNEVGLIYW